jgi:hypothetical protein
MASATATEKAERARERAVGRAEDLPRGLVEDAARLQVVGLLERLQGALHVRAGAPVDLARREPGAVEENLRAHDVVSGGGRLGSRLGRSRTREARYGQREAHQHEG